MTTTAYQKNNPNLRSPKMQHVRHVKPEFYVHEGINDMTVSARYAETGTWTCCDKNGRFEWKPRMLKRLVMPYDDADFESLMNEWVNHGFAEKYEVNGETYGRFINWEKHQGINLREKQSAFEYPAPNDDNNDPARARTNAAHADTCLHVQAPADTCAVKGLGLGSGQVKGQSQGQFQCQSQDKKSAPVSATVATKNKTTSSGKHQNLFGNPSPNLTEPEDGAGKEDEPPTPSPVSAPAQVSKIGDIPKGDIDVMLPALTDGLFEMGALDKKTPRWNPVHIPDLTTACTQAIRKYYSTPLTDRSVLVTILNDIINTLTGAEMRYPPGLLKTVKRLQESDGELQLSLHRPQRLVFGDVFKNGVLSPWEKELSPYHELMQKLTSMSSTDWGGVPQTLQQGDEFLDRVLVKLQENNESTEVVEEVQEKLRAQMPKVLPVRRKR